MANQQGAWVSTPIAALPQDVKTAWAVLFKMIEEGKIERNSPPEVMLEILKLAYDRVLESYDDFSALYLN